jgi:two-component system LytT family response regulator
MDHAFAPDRRPVRDVPPLRVMIAEDEPGSRARLRQLVQRAPGLQLVAECRNGRETVDVIRRARPSVVFLDVQMPGLNGFDVLAALGPDAPVIVFVTAFDQYAVRAFDVNAADYLLKPFDDRRFGRTVARIRAALAARAGSARTGRAATVAPPAARLAVQSGGTLRFLDVGAITRITAEDCYARIHCDEGPVLVREPLSGLEARLPPGVFRRVHRSALVNVRHVTLIAPVSHGDLRLRLSDGSEVRVSRRYRAAIRDLGVR